MKDKEQVEAWSASEAQVRLDLIKIAYEKYEDACISLCVKSNLDQYEADNMQNQNDEMQTLMLSLKAILHAHQKQLEKAEAKVNAQNECRALQTTPHAVEPEFTCNPFSGKVDDWFNFQSDFEGAMAKKTKMNQSDKLDKLKARCNGKAKLFISQVSRSEFDEAMKQLNDIFGSTYMQLQFHLLNLLETPNMESASRR